MNRELTEFLRSFLFEDAIKNDRHHTLDKEKALKLYKNLIFAKLSALSEEKQKTLSLFLHQHPHTPPHSYRDVTNHFNIDIAAANGILNYE